MVLKMNLSGIFLAKCLIVLFFCVKGSAEQVNQHYRLGATASLDIPGFKAEMPYEIRWLKDQKPIMKRKKSIDTFYMKDKERFKMSSNGTLYIHSLVKMDTGLYVVEVYDTMGREQVKKKLNMTVHEPVYKPKLKWKCLNKKTATVTCEVTQKDRPIFNLSANGKPINVPTPPEKNSTWKIEYKTSALPAVFQCNVQNEVSMETEEKEIKCSGLDIVLILSIAGGAVFFVIFLALLIYCIRKKRAERFQEQVADEEILMQRQQVDNELKHRALPQPPDHGPQKQPRQPRRPPPQPQTQLQEAPPRPRPRTQQKSPHHIKERP